jgi:N-acyl amino acid synthase of PEP-CTERM/exosortase system
MTHLVSMNIETEVKDALVDFKKRYAILEANTPTLRKRAYQVRHDVFVREKTWESDEDAEHQENDAYDPIARHGLVFDKGSGCDIGVVRVVCSQLETGLMPALPMLKHLPADHPLHDPAALAMYSEASRFCVVEQMRRRQGEAESEMGLGGYTVDSGDGAVTERRRLPYAPFGLIQFIARCTVENGSCGVMAVMEPFLIRALAKFGFEFFPVADAIEFRGTRYPTLLPDIAVALDKVWKKSEETWAIVSDDGMLHDLALEVCHDRENSDFLERVAATMRPLSDIR